jgi:hypothetical protein
MAVVVARSAAQEASQLLLKPLDEQARAAYRATGVHAPKPKPAQTKAPARTTAFNRPHFSSVSGMFCSRRSSWSLFVLCAFCLAGLRALLRGRGASPFASWTGCIGSSRFQPPRRSPTLCVPQSHCPRSERKLDHCLAL